MQAISLTTSQLNSMSTTEVFTALGLRPYDAERDGPARGTQRVRGCNPDAHTVVLGPQKQ